jgi:hypothetical protein
LQDANANNQNPLLRTQRSKQLCDLHQFPKISSIAISNFATVGIDIQMFKGCTRETASPVVELYVMNLILLQWRRSTLFREGYCRHGKWWQCKGAVGLSKSF